MIHEFASAPALAKELAQQVAAALHTRIVSQGEAALAVSGGTTPVRFFQALSATPLDWRHVTITLVDERWVPETSPRSNAALVRTHLLQGAAAAARFIPLVSMAATPEADSKIAAMRLAELPLPALPPWCWAWGWTGIRLPSSRAETGWPRRSLLREAHTLNACAPLLP